MTNEPYITFLLLFHAIKENVEYKNLYIFLRSLPSFYRFLNKQINIAMVLLIWEKPKGSIFIYIFEKKTHL